MGWTKDAMMKLARGTIVFASCGKRIKTTGLCEQGQNRFSIIVHGKRRLNGAGECAAKGDRGCKLRSIAM